RAHCPKPPVSRVPGSLPDSSARRSVLLNYLLGSSPGFEVLGTSETCAVANSVPTAIDFPPSLFGFHTRREIGINLSTRRLPPRRVFLFALLRHTRTRNRTRLRALLAALSPRHHLVMINQKRQQLIR